VSFALVALERPSRVEHAAEQSLLTVNDVRIDAAALERLRELPCFLRELLGAPGTILIAHLVERRRDHRAAAAELTRLFTTLLVELRAPARNQLRGLSVQRALLLSPCP
jgi:hypothetical protein